MDSHGRYLEETIGNTSSTSSSFRVLFKPVASTHQYNSIEGVPRRWMGEGSFVIVHLGSNNISNRDGTEKESANTIIKNIVDTCMKAKRVSPNVMYSSILLPCGEQWVNDRVRYVNCHVRNELVAQGVTFLDHTRCFLAGKNNVRAQLFSYHDGLHMNHQGKHTFPSTISWLFS